jgi:hypothetical protein
LRLGEVCLRVFHELGLGLFSTEAVGLAFDLRIDGAVGFDLLAGCEAL